MMNSLLLLGHAGCCRGACRKTPHLHHRLRFHFGTQMMLSPAATPTTPTPQSSPHFPEALLALVRLLAREAAREAFATRCNTTGEA